MEIANTVLTDCLFHVLHFGKDYRAVFRDQYVFFETARDSQVTICDFSGA